ncbi:MAG: sigma 54-interacting transcriptional regulator [Myxococcales bacterium]|nr:sigma 54-interacting transcriptional regulator [Myxococcales bacterium]
MTQRTNTFSITREGATEFLELPRLRVTLTAPDGTVRTTQLGVSPILIGTAEGNELVATDSSVSRVHAELRSGSDGVVVKDLGSKNGVTINGVRVFEALVPAGQLVALGRSTLTVSAEGLERLPLSGMAHFGEALGSSPVMRALFAVLARAADATVPILLLGESGTGKELLARAVHDASPRAGKSFVVFDCGAVTGSLVEAELFGALKGAYTGADRDRQGLLEAAHGGTLFLDEIGELSPDLQAKLLRALEAKQVRPVGSNTYRPADARIVGATHRDLRAKVANGSFREDLYFRLAVVTADVPPLRERTEDIPLLVQHFLSRQTPARTLAELPPNVLSLLQHHDWPGNVRELWNTMTRLVLFPQLGAKAIEHRQTARLANALESVAHLPLREAREVVVAEFELSYLVHKLKEHSDNVSAAAKAMGVSRQFLYRLLHRHGLTERDERE